MARNKSPEESGEGARPARGSSGPFEGGFSEGQMGRGPTPYKKSHSPKPNGHSMEAHLATSGRGDSGIIGGADGNKGPKEDLQHPQSHGAFESLGTAEE